MPDLNDSTPLSSDAMRVLRAIHARGLTVLWSFKVPRPEYDDDEPMSDEDWRIVDEQLGHTEYVPSTAIVTGGRMAREVSLVRNGQRVVEKRVSDLAPDGTPRGSEWVIDARSVMERWVPDEPEYEMSRKMDFTYMPVSGYERWASDYLTVDREPADDWTEERVGLRSRYTLTDKALALIGGAS